MAVGDQLFLREHWEIMADIKAIKKDLEEGNMTRGDIIRKIELIEGRIHQNDLEHAGFVGYSKELIALNTSIKEMKGGVVVLTPEQAKKGGNSWLAVLFKNPTHLMYIVLGAIVITMVIMGYSFIEINQVIQRLH